MPPPVQQVGIDVSPRTRASGSDVSELSLPPADEVRLALETPTPEQSRERGKVSNPNENLLTIAINGAGCDEIKRSEWIARIRELTGPDTQLIENKDGSYLVGDLAIAGLGAISSTATERMESAAYEDAVSMMVTGLKQRKALQVIGHSAGPTIAYAADRNLRWGVDIIQEEDRWRLATEDDDPEKVEKFRLNGNEDKTDFYLGMYIPSCPEDNPPAQFVFDGDGAAWSAGALNNATSWARNSLDQAYDDAPEHASVEATTLPGSYHYTEWYVMHFAEFYAAQPKYQAENGMQLLAQDAVRLIREGRFTDYHTTRILEEGYRRYGDDFCCELERVDGVRADENGRLTIGKYIVPTKTQLIAGLERYEIEKPEPTTWAEETGKYAEEAGEYVSSTVRNWWDHLSGTSEEE